MDFSMLNLLSDSDGEKESRVVLKRKRKRKRDDKNFQMCPMGARCYRTMPAHFWELWHPPFHLKEKVLRLSYTQEQLDRAKARDLAMGLLPEEDYTVPLTDDQLAKHLRVYVAHQDKGTEFDRQQIKRLMELALGKHAKHKKSRFDMLMKETKKYLNRMVQKLTRQNNLSKQQEGELQNWINSGVMLAKLKQPKCLKFGTLKDYQLVGLNWLVTLHRLGLNGILADEMGLGKTIQTIALFAHLKETLQTSGPHLVVIPLSTLNGWKTAFRDWCPSLNILVHHGQVRDLRYEKLKQVDSEDVHVVLTTYEICLNDVEELATIDWKYLVIDEAHRLKNRSCKLVACLKVLSSDTSAKLLLTGTPLQNNLGELWSLLNFTLPDLFDSSETFEKWFASHFEISKSHSKTAALSEVEKLAVAQRLHQVLRPFLLRTTKKEVPKNLIAKKSL